MPEPSLNLLVIRAADLERSVRFYSALGLHFVREQHGAGPGHYACTTGSLVLEIHPDGGVTSSTSATRLGFLVDDVDATVTRLLRAGGLLVSPPKDVDGRRKAVVNDPDDHRIELTGRGRPSNSSPGMRPPAQGAHG